MIHVDIFCLAGVINSSGGTLVPLYSPDVKDDLAESRRLNQSDAASCVTSRSHGYLAATATGVNVSCQIMMDEEGWEKKTYNHKFAHTHICMDALAYRPTVSIPTTGVQMAVGRLPCSICEKDLSSLKFVTHAMEMLAQTSSSSAVIRKLIH